MNLEIITPDKKVYSGVVDSVILPGSGGGFQILKDHAPIVSTLAKGNLVIEANGKKETFVVDGGVVEAAKNKVLVLAEAVS
ncbi:ATP synthase F1 subunit epsilon [Emticicia sp. SJ17W-69]|uniref:ATP synthase F1 subunit epsilon n=1 Tax=Emticicia sp. SJ17W-69 TaxID=3421657 RepID=UPI003EB7D11E